VKKPFENVIVKKLYENNFEFNLIDILLLLSRNIFIKDYDYLRNIRIMDFGYLNGDIHYPNICIGNNKYAKVHHTQLYYIYIKRKNECYEGINLLKIFNINYYNKYIKKTESNFFGGIIDYIKKIFKSNDEVEYVEEKYIEEKYIEEKNIQDNIDDNMNNTSNNIGENKYINKKLKYHIHENVKDRIPKEILLNFDSKYIKNMDEITFSEFKKMYIQYLKKNNKITNTHIIINNKYITINELNYELMELLD
jgi:hypothetical protein